jgi:hypothetical protein
MEAMDNNRSLNDGKEGCARETLEGFPAPVGSNFRTFKF